MTSPEQDAAMIGEAVTELVWWGTRSAYRRQMSLPSGSPVDAWLLRTIAKADRIRPGDLALLQGVDKSTVTPQLRRLEALGLIAREPDPGDRRSVVIRLTDLGGETLAKLAAKSSAVLSPALESWSDEDRHTLATLLSRLSEDLREESAREAPAPA